MNILLAMIVWYIPGWMRTQTGRRHLDAGDETPVEAEAEKPPVISIFTSAQERAVFARVLRNAA